MIPSSPLPSPYPSEELTDRQGRAVPISSFYRLGGREDLTNNGCIATVGKVGGKSLCPRAQKGCAEASGKFGLERLGHGAAAAEAGGNSGERRHHDHGPRHHGE